MYRRFASLCLIVSLFFYLFVCFTSSFCCREETSNYLSYNMGYTIKRAYRFFSFHCYLCKLPILLISFSIFIL